MRGFSATLGIVLSVVGIAGMLLSSQSWMLHLSSGYDVVYLLTGILAFMVVFERRWVARRAWMVIAAAHASLLVLTAAGILNTHVSVVFFSAAIAVGCLVANRRVKITGRRRSRFIRFDARLASERPDLVAVHEGSGSV